jgi:hypothetical protein
VSDDCHCNDRCDDKKQAFLSDKYLKDDQSRFSRPAYPNPMVICLIFALGMYLCQFNAAVENISCFQAITKTRDFVPFLSGFEDEQ